MAKRQHAAVTDEERAERRKREQQLTEQAVAQLPLKRRLAALVDRPRARQAAALQPRYLGWLVSPAFRQRLRASATCRR